MPSIIERYRSSLSRRASSARFRSSRCIARRPGIEEGPARFSIEAAHAHFDLTRFAGGQNRTPIIEQRRRVFGANRTIPAPATGLLETETRVIAPALIEEIDVP